MEDNAGDKDGKFEFSFELKQQLSIFYSLKLKFKDKKMIYLILGSAPVLFRITNTNKTIKIISLMVVNYICQSPALAGKEKTKRQQPWFSPGGRRRADSDGKEDKKALPSKDQLGDPGKGKRTEQKERSKAQPRASNQHQASSFTRPRGNSANQSFRTSGGSSSKNWRETGNGGGKNAGREMECENEAKAEGHEKKSDSSSKRSSESHANNHDESLKNGQVQVHTDSESLKEETRSKRADSGVDSDTQATAN